MITPTAAAMRAVKRFAVLADSPDRQYAAAVIDNATGLPELIAALRLAENVICEFPIRPESIEAVKAIDAALSIAKEGRK